MTANYIGNTAVIHPVIVVKISGYKFRALSDSGASHSYTSSIDLIHARPKSTGLKHIPTLQPEIKVTFTKNSKNS